MEGDGPAEDAAELAQPRKKLLAESYAPTDPGPYPQDKPPENTVRFTPVQVFRDFEHSNFELRSSTVAMSKAPENTVCFALVQVI